MENNADTTPNQNPNPARSPSPVPSKTTETEEQNFGTTPNQPAEINPGKLDTPEIDLDRSGVDNSKGHEPYEFKNSEGEDEEAGKENLMGQGGYGSQDGSTGPDQPATDH